LAKTNYSFEKRQREIARKKKQDEKRQKKQQTRVTDTLEPGSPPEPTPPSETPAAG
jgi:hypothetical protein